MEKNGSGKVFWKKPAGVFLGIFLLAGSLVTPSYAQSYPDKPIRMVIIFPPGGAIDTLGRIVATKLSETIGQPVVPENRGGAGGNVGLDFAAKARPDGYTIVIGSETLVLSPSLYKQLSYDATKDLQPIARVAQVPVLLLVRPDFPAKTLRELVAYAKDNPRKITFGTGGVGSAPHLGGELLKNIEGIDIMHVPYKGVAPAMVGMLGGEIDLSILSVATAATQVDDGKVRALAVLSDSRALRLPDVPTAKEAGVDNLVVPIWYGFFAPAGTPRTIIDKLNAEINKVVAMPEVKESIQKAGMEVLSGGTPDEFAEFIKGEIPIWQKVIEGANIPKID